MIPLLLLMLLLVSAQQEEPPKEVGLEEQSFTNLPASRESFVPVRYENNCERYPYCCNYTPPACPKNSFVVQKREKILCTDSMFPLFGCDTLNWAFYPQGYDVGVCDVIAYDIPHYFQKDERGKVVEVTFLVHRVVGFDGVGLVTEGDNGRMVDEYIPGRSEVKWVLCN